MSAVLASLVQYIVKVLIFAGSGVGGHHLRKEIP